MNHAPSPGRQALLSIALGFVLAGLVAVILAFLWPPEPAALSVWNWDRFTHVTSKHQ